LPTGEASYQAIKSPSARAPNTALQPVGKKNPAEAGQLGLQAAQQELQRGQGRVSKDAELSYQHFGLWRTMPMSVIHSRSSGHPVQINVWLLDSRVDSM
jgi:hypothetical protein